MGDDDRWPDKNGNAKVNAGRSKAREAAQRNNGCNVAFPAFKEETFERLRETGEKLPTDFNDLHVLEGLEAVKQQLTEALTKPPEPCIPDCFDVDDRGVHYKGEEQLTLCEPPLYVTARTRDERNQNQGRLLEWKDDDGVSHQWAAPNRMLSGDGGEVRAKLLDEGLIIYPSQGARAKFSEYLLRVKPEKRIISLSTTGWNEGCFALPDIIFPNDGNRVLQSDNQHLKTFKTSGTLEEWQTHIAQYAKGNSRLTFVLALAFAAPLLELTKGESGTVHIIGKSSNGKTTALRMSGSVWGGSGGENGFVKQWRTTPNALEALAESHCDCLLPLDELSQADAKSIGDSAYMIANNQGKHRMTRSAIARPIYEWRVLVLSSGEGMLDDKLEEAGKKAMAGMDVRFVSLPSDAGKGNGVAETLHGFPDSGAFADHLKTACTTYYGTAIRAFLPRLVKEINEDKDKVVKLIKSLQDKFAQDHLPKGADGQVRRVVGRFGLIAAAGELAINYGILPLSEGDAVSAVAVCFNSWLDLRGGIGALEETRGIAQIRGFLENHGDSRFVKIKNGELSEDYSNVRDRMGFREADTNGAYHYYVLSESFKEMCAGRSVKDMPRILHQHGMLHKTEKDTFQVSKRLPGLGKQKRVYHILPSIFEGEADVTQVDSDAPKPVHKFAAKKRSSEQGKA